MLKWFYPGGAFPVIELLGAAGSGKTTAAQLLAMLVDPRSSGRAVTPRTLKIEEFGPLAQAHAVLVLDNLSRLSPQEQDLLCITATGAEIGTRTLHTTGQVTVFSVHARLLLTGISPAVTRADLLDRCIRVNVTAPASRRSEEELSSWFNGQKAQLLGALFALLSAALRHLPRVKPATHRLVEFQRLGFAVFAAMGRSPDEFEALFARHRAEIAGYNADADPFTRTLLAALEAAEASAVEAEALPGWRTWADKGKPGFCAVRKPGGEVVIAATPGGLLALLKSHAPIDISLDRYRREAAIPPHARGVEGAVLRVHPTLRDLGWHVVRKPFSESRAAQVFMRGGPSPDRG
jgi:MoxR-like ATPase